MRLYLSVALSLLAFCLILSGCSRAAAPAPAPSDEYQVIMWVLDGVPNQDLFFQRMRDLNVTGIQVSNGDQPDAPLAHGFNYYVENIHRIGFLHEANKVYRSDWDNYTKTHDKRYLVRNPCLHDPAYLAKAKGILQSAAQQYVNRTPLLYDIGDECSITSFASPMDYCFSDYTLNRFREWLEQQYGTLDKLNAQWETSFASWDAVQPMTTYEIKDREKKSSENYSPWADHRTFMDITYSDTLDQFRRWLHEVDPKTPAGLEGTQMPAAFGGYDLWRLSHALDWVEPYDIGGSHAIFRSFLPAGTPIYATIFEHDARPASRRLWHLLLNGDHGAIIWCSSDWFDYKSPDLTPQPWVSGMSDLFSELRGPAAKAIMNAKRDRAQVAIHYSHPSIQAGWMIDSRPDGDTWVRRFSSYEGVHSVITRVRNAWMKMIEDLGFQYDFVSSQQIEEGKLGALGYKVLVLPESLAISDREAEQIKAFVRSGGTVIADVIPGVFDEHAKRRNSGVLDSFFGVARTARGMIVQPEISAGIGFTLQTGNANSRLREQAAAGAKIGSGEETAKLGEQPAAGPALIPFGPAETNLSFVVGKPGAMVNTPVAAKKPIVNVPVVIERSIDKGRTIYLNISPIDYPKDRLVGKGDQLRDLVGDLLAGSGVRPAVKVTENGGAPVGCEVIAYQGDGRRYLAIMRNPEFDISDLGEIGFTDNSRFEKPQPLAIEFPRPISARSLLTGAEFTQTATVNVTLDPWKPVILELR